MSKLFIVLLAILTPLSCFAKLLDDYGCVIKHKGEDNWTKINQISRTEEDTIFSLDHILNNLDSAETALILSAKEYYSKLYSNGSTTIRTKFSVLEVLKGNYKRNEIILGRTFPNGDSDCVNSDHLMGPFLGLVAKFPTKEKYYEYPFYAGGTFLLTEPLFKQIRKHLKQPDIEPK